MINKPACVYLISTLQEVSASTKINRKNLFAYSIFPFLFQVPRSCGRGRIKYHTSQWVDLNLLTTWSFFLNTPYAQMSFLKNSTAGGKGLQSQALFWMILAKNIREALTNQNERLKDVWCFFNENKLSLVSICLHLVRSFVNSDVKRDRREYYT